MRLVICSTAALILVALPGGLLAQESAGISTPEPALPYVDKGACPFEGCRYGAWTARKDMPVYDTWQEGRKQAGTVAKGNKVTALGGIVVTFKPGVIHMDRDLPEKNLRRGDTILTYTYLGEGVSKAWVNGRFYEALDISFTKWPNGMGCGGAHCAATYLDLGTKEWWAELKLPTGATVWVAMDNASMGNAEFDGMDLVATPVTP